MQNMDINKFSKAVETFISIIPFFTFIVFIGSSIQTYYFSDKFTKKFLTTNTLQFLGKIFDTIILLFCNLLLSIGLIIYIFNDLKINLQEVIKILYQKGFAFKEFFYLFSIVYISSFFLQILFYMLIKEFINTDKYPKKSQYYVLASDISLPVSLEKDTKLYLVQIHKNKECILIFWKGNNFKTLPNRIIVNYSELRNKIIYTESKISFIQSWKKINTDFLNTSIKNKMIIFAILIGLIIVFYIFSLLVNNKEIFKNSTLLIGEAFFLTFSRAIFIYFRKLLSYIFKNIFKRKQRK
ncbi:TPA: hypothetical protein ACN1M8_002584 [Enterococcus faecium]|uniref:hypothetical protein n=3 Tax=Enterococcus TaxID=1350 RepID=UPI0009C0C88D|nr:hypothetical protein [Enterococcus faecium]OQO64431.1 hypothetical protein BH743_12155 [Enterococcus faecium]